MMAAQDPTIHASAVLVGAKAALIRGPAGSGKSQLVWELVTASSQGMLPFVRLVADDRVHVENHSGRLLVRPAPALAGMIEVRGLGIRRIEFEPVALVGMIIVSWNRRLHSSSSPGSLYRGLPSQREWQRCLWC